MTDTLKARVEALPRYSPNYAGEMERDSLAGDWLSRSDVLALFADAPAPPVEAASGWQPMSAAIESGMEDGTPCLVYHADWGMSVQWFATKGTYRGFNWRGDPGTAEPTHWMPLPPSPTESEA